MKLLSNHFAHSRCYGCMAPAGVYDTEGADLYLVPKNTGVGLSRTPTRLSAGNVALCDTCALPYLVSFGGHRFAVLPPSANTQCLVCFALAGMAYKGGFVWRPCVGTATPPVAIPVVRVCECGGKTAGARDFAPGHASYCPVRE